MHRPGPKYLYSFETTIPDLVALYITGTNVSCFTQYWNLSTSEVLISSIKYLQTHSTLCLHRKDRLSVPQKTIRGSQISSEIHKNFEMERKFPNNPRNIEEIFCPIGNTAVISGRYYILFLFWSVGILVLYHI